MFASGRLSWGEKSLWTQWVQHKPFFVFAQPVQKLVQWQIHFWGQFLTSHLLVSFSLRWCPSEQWPGEKEWKTQRPHPGVTRNEKLERSGETEPCLVGCQLWKWGSGGLRGSGHVDQGGVCSSSLIHVEKAPASGQSYCWCWGGEWGVRRMEACCCCTR